MKRGKHESPKRRSRVRQKADDALKLLNLIEVAELFPAHGRRSIG